MRNGALFEIGAPGPTRTDTVRPLKPLPLPIGVQTLEVEDQAGFEPAESLRCRLKRPARSAATVTGPVESKWSQRPAYAKATAGEPLVRGGCPTNTRRPG